MNVKMTENSRHVSIGSCWITLHFIKLRDKLFSYFIYPFQVSPSHKISEVKDILAMQVSIPTEEQKLVFKGKTLLGK